MRALQLPDEAALLRAMGRGELEARVDEYERAVGVAPADVSAELTSVRAPAQGAGCRGGRGRGDAGDITAAQAAEVRAAMHAEETWPGLRVADAARREWAEATAGQEAAARGPAERVAAAAEAWRSADSRDRPRRGGGRPSRRPIDANRQEREWAEFL